jgi:hypothetical protein
MRGKWLGLAVPLCVVGCHAKMSGDLRVDGSTFSVTECRSGQAFGFSGIQFADAAGNHIRVLLQADGSAVAAIFKPHAKRGDRLGACAQLDMHAQHSRINSITNVEGNATFNCKAVGHEVLGKVTFENCH